MDVNIFRGSVFGISEKYDRKALQASKFCEIFRVALQTVKVSSKYFVRLECSSNL